MRIHQFRIDLAILDEQLARLRGQLPAQALMRQVLGRDLDARGMRARQLQIDGHCLLQEEENKQNSIIVEFGG